MLKNPSYKEVCAETTGHAEVVQITFDPEVVSFSEILEVFFVTHDPTTLNRQGNDVGTQYRSAIFYHSEGQKQTATQIISQLEKEKVYKNPIVTEVTAFDEFYIAEDYHINYFARNKNQPYCQFVVAPKVEKFKKVFKEKMKNNSDKEFTDNDFYKLTKIQLCYRKKKKFNIRSKKYRITKA